MKAAPWIAYAALFLTLTVIGAVRQRPLRLSGLGVLAVAGALLASCLTFVRDQSVASRLSELCFVLGSAGAGYFIASPFAPFKFIPAAMLVGFPDEQAAEDHDKQALRQQWRIAGGILLAAVPAALLLMRTDF